MPQPQLISLGSINIDYQLHIAHWPQPGETLIGHELVRTGGGKAANVAFIARRLGVEATLVANVGDDRAAEHALAGLAAIGVDLRAAGLVERGVNAAFVKLRPAPAL